MARSVVQLQCGCDSVHDFEESALMAKGDLIAGQTTLVLLGRFRNGKNLRGAGVMQVNR